MSRKNSMTDHAREWLLRNLEAEALHGLNDDELHAMAMDGGESVLVERDMKARQASRRPVSWSLSDVVAFCIEQGIPEKQP